MLRDRRIGVIGGGKMGGALIDGIISRGLVQPSAVTVSDTLAERREELKARCGVTAKRVVRNDGATWIDGMRLTGEMVEDDE